MRRPRLLLVEDEVSIINSLRRPLENLGFEVTTADDGVIALRTWQQTRPDVVILDIGLRGKRNGLDILKEARDTKDIRHTIVLMMTASKDRREESYGLSAEDYFVKPIQLSELKARLRSLMPRIRQYRRNPARCLYNLRIRNDQPIQITVEGPHRLYSSTHEPQHFATHLLGRKAQLTLRAREWRTLAADDGRRLFEQVFRDEVLASYKRAVGLEADASVHLRIDAPSDYLAIPFEFLRDPTATHGEDYVALLHPLSRSILDVSGTRQPLDESLLNELISSGNPLKILLMASNTTPSIPGADAEALWLYQNLGELFNGSGVQTEITYLPTEKATLKNVEEALSGGEHHIWHYCGHGHFDGNAPERSGLPFWSGPRRGGPVRMLTTNRLHHLLRTSGIRAAYLSCCYGSTSGSGDQSSENAFLGIAQAIVRSGVPSVMGFCASVSDSGAREMAEESYRWLAETGDLENAVFQARLHMASEYPDDQTWISFVIVNQR